MLISSSDTASKFLSVIFGFMIFILDWRNCHPKIEQKNTLLKIGNTHQGTVYEQLMQEIAKDVQY